MIDATKYPQLAKMQEVQEASQAIGEFLEWLDEQRIGLASVIRGEGHDRWAPITEGHEKLIARHFDIDLNAVERERRAVLAAHVSSENECSTCKHNAVPMGQQPCLTCLGRGRPKWEPAAGVAGAFESQRKEARDGLGN